MLASALAPEDGQWIGLRATVVISVLIMAVAMVGFTQVQADWSAGTEIAIILVLGFGFGLGMPSLTDAIMAAVPVEDAGVGSAVNDVSRELGSALGVAVLGSFINGLYRSNVRDELEGAVPDEAVHIAEEGIGVVAAAAPTLPADVAATTFDAASTSFVDAMNSGFWLSAGIMFAGAVAAVFLLPRRARTDQAQRHDGIDFDAELIKLTETTNV